MTKIAIIETFPDAKPLRNKVSYGPDGVNDAVLASAEAVILGLQGEFLAGAEDDLKSIQNLYDAAAALPEDERPHYFRVMFGLAHGLMGQGGSFGFPIVTKVAGALGRFVDSRDRFGADELEAIRVHIEALRAVIADRVSGDGGPAGATMLEGLKRIFDGFRRD